MSEHPYGNYCTCGRLLSIEGDGDEELRLLRVFRGEIERELAIFDSTPGHGQPKNFEGARYRLTAGVRSALVRFRESQRVAVPPPSKRG